MHSEFYYSIFCPIWTINEVKVKGKPKNVTHQCQSSSYFIKYFFNIGMSSSVFLNNLDDFIAPSQACVNPLVSSKLKSQTVQTKGPSGKITLETDYSTSDFADTFTSTTKPDLIKSTITSAGKNVATVSLNDCLACSGCVTSAEAILIAEQSSEKFLRILETAKNSNTIVVIQISPNSRASLADFLGLSPIETFLAISSILKQKGVTYVLDSSTGADIMLMEIRKEFLQRYN
jgi:hypothetical protein